MKIIMCTNNDEAESSLTLGKQYSVQGVCGEDRDKYILIDDTGISHVWYQWRFITLEGSLKK
jgi:hypothetical protein